MGGTTYLSNFYEQSFLNVSSVATFIPIIPKATTYTKSQQLIKYQQTLRTKSYWRKNDYISPPTPSTNVPLSRSQVHCHYPSLSFASKLSWFIIITTWHSISPTIFRSWPLLQSSTIDQIPLSLWHQEFPLIWYNWTFKYNWTLTIAHWT